MAEIVTAIRDLGVKCNTECPYHNKHYCTVFKKRISNNTKLEECLRIIPIENKIVVLCAPSSAGKDTLAKLISDKLGYSFVISHTTRPMREGESEGNPYHFVTDEEFDKTGFIEQRHYNTILGIWKYGVATLEIRRDTKYVVVLDVEGLLEFKKHFSNRVISFYIDVDDEERLRRAIERGSFDISEWMRRLEDDAKVFKDKSIFDYMVRNDNINKCFSDIVKKLS